MLFNSKAYVAVRSSRIQDTMTDSFYINGSCPGAGKVPVNKTISRSLRDKSAVFAVSDGIGYGRGVQLSAYKPLSILKKFQSKLIGVHSENISKALSPYFKHSNSIFSSLGESSQGASLAMLVINSGVATAVNIGNARIYHHKYGRLFRISKEDTEAERLLSIGAIRNDEVLSHPSKSLITGYLGISSDSSQIFPHYSDPIAVEKGDAFLICSNGITDVLSDDRLSYIMSVKSSDERIVQRLLSEAVARGASDNITAMIVRVGKSRKSSRVKRGFIRLSLVAIVLALLISFVSSALKSCNNSRAVNNEQREKKTETVSPTPTPEFILRPSE